MPKGKTKPVTEAAPEQLGTWMPVEIGRDHSYSWREKAFMSEIVYFYEKGRKPGCYLSDGWLAWKFQMNRSNVHHVIDCLEKKGKINTTVVNMPGKQKRRYITPVEGAVNTTTSVVKSTTKGAVISTAHENIVLKQEKTSGINPRRGNRFSSTEPTSDPLPVVRGSDGLTARERYLKEVCGD